MCTTEEVGAAGDPFRCRADLQSQSRAVPFTPTSRLTALHIMHRDTTHRALQKVLEETFEDPFDLQEAAHVAAANQNDCHFVCGRSVRQGERPSLLSFGRADALACTG